MKKNWEGLTHVRAGPAVQQGLRSEKNQAKAQSIDRKVRIGRLGSLLGIGLLILLLTVIASLYLPESRSPRNLGPATIPGDEGYIDKTGKLAIPLQFERAKDFSEGLAAVKSNGKWGYIDTAGRIAIPPQFQFTGDFSEGLACVGLGSQHGPPDWRYGYIDKAGQFVFPAELENIRFFHEGLAAVKLNGKWGYIDKTGQLVIPLQFQRPSLFQEGLAFVPLDDGRWGVIDKAGRLVSHTEGQFGLFLGVSSEGLASVQIGEKWGYVEKSGRLVIPPRFELMPGFFHEGLADVWLDKKTGYIDKTGQLAIPAQFDDASKFVDGLAAVAVRAK